MTSVNRQSEFVIVTKKGYVRGLKSANSVIRYTDDPNKAKSFPSKDALHRWVHSHVNLGYDLSWEDEIQLEEYR